MYEIKSFFGGVGVIGLNNSNTVVYSVSGQKELIEVIISFFLKYPLLTQKGADFLLFKSVVELIIKKQHLTIEGLHKILSIRASINRGLTKELIESFPNVIPIYRSIINPTGIPDPNWIAGFSSGESCFDIKIVNNIKYKTGSQVQTRFRISQHLRDNALLEFMIEYLKCGRLQPSRNTVELTVSKYGDIINVIIPFFEEYPILGVKQLDYNDFKTVVYLLKEKAHLTTEGLEKIYEIKAGMNTARVYS